MRPKLQFFDPAALAQVLEQIEQEVEADATEAMRSADPRTSRSILDALFSSTQLRLLGMLFGQPDRQFHINALMQKTGCGSGAVQRELARLERVQCLRSERDRGRRYYQANERSPLHAELCAMFTKAAVAAPIRSVLETVESDIDLAFVCQAGAPLWTRPPPLQLVILAEDCPDGLHAALASASQVLDRRIEPLVLEPERGGHFIEFLLTLPRTWVIGSDERLGALRHARP
jgi:hypothetical protein